MKRFSEYFTKDGREQPDSTPVAPPVGYERQPSLAERIQSIVRSEQMALAARSAGFETFEESEDFDVDDDFDPQSPWENDFDPPIAELRKREAEFNASGRPAEQNEPEPRGERSETLERPGEQNAPQARGKRSETPDEASDGSSEES